MGKTRSKETQLLGRLDSTELLYGVLYNMPEDFVIREEELEERLGEALKSVSQTREVRKLRSSLFSSGSADPVSGEQANSGYRDSLGILKVCRVISTESDSIRFYEDGREVIKLLFDEPSKSAYLDSPEMKAFASRVFGAAD